VAIACSGTVTLECAWHGLPTVVLYKLSWPTYLVARQIVQVKFIAMPNLLADERVYPEFIQAQATPENLAREAAALLDDPHRRAQVAASLARIRQSLGPPGAVRRAAEAIARLMRA
jgi:lipid-A-disaccharide synthase